MKNILILLIGLLLSNNEQEKKYSVSLTLTEWDGICAGLRSSTQISAATSNGYIQIISNQVNS